MPFNPVTWVNKVTKLGPTNLNRIETGVDDAHAGLLDAQAIDTAVIKDLAVTTGKLADLAVTAAKIAANTVTAAKIAADTITANEIAANAVGASELADGSVDTGALIDASVTAAKVATLTKKVTVPIERQTAAGTASAWPDASASDVVLGFLVPGDYVSGDITIKWMVFSSTGSANNVRYLWTVQRWRDGAALSSIETSVEELVGAWTANFGKVISRAIVAAGFQAGDVLLITLQRDGAHASDTFTGAVVTLSQWIEYTGRI